MSRKKFESLIKSKQCVVIAKDAIKIIYLKRIIANRGAYLWNNKNDSFPNNNENCNVCALAALFVAKYDRINGDWASNFGDLQRWLRESLSKYFSVQQLEQIEDAFEQIDPSWSNLDNDEDCLIGIMQNIVDHKGQFKSDVEYEVS